MSTDVKYPTFNDDNGEESEEDFNPGEEVGSDVEEEPRRAAPVTKRAVTPKSEAEDDDVKEPDSPKPAVEDDGDVEEIADNRAAGQLNETDDAPVEDEDEQAEGANGDDDDDEDDEDEDEDEEDEVRGHRQKRRKRDRRNQFIDVEAEVDEEDEEADEDEDDLPEGFVADIHPDDEGLAGADDHDDRRHRDLDRRRQEQEDLNAEEQAALYKERYGAYGRNRAAASDAVIVPQRLLLPSVEDPTIWGVKCKPGKEREVVFAIMKRVEERRHTPQALSIFSAFERGGTMAGYVYVEARKHVDVVEACESILNCYARTKGVLVPINEMPDLLKTRKSKTLSAGMYVRLKRGGKYQGDLAQVEDVDANGLEATLRVVPRLDYGLTEDANAPLGADSKRKRGGGNFGKHAASNRPHQRLFSDIEARKKHSRFLQQIGGHTGKQFSYLGDTYVDGFLMKEFKVNQLQAEDVNPKLEEVTKFTSSAEDGTIGLDLNQLAATLRSTNGAEYYLPGDMVEIYQGEQRGIQGKAIRVHGDIVTLAVISRDNNTRTQTIEAPIKTLRKLFREGDHVKVIGGSKYTDEVGMVVRIKDDRITILSDATNIEITVFSRDLRAATDSVTQTGNTKFDLYDLVQLDSTTVAVVVKVDRESLRVLDQDGSVRTLLPSAIGNKLEKRRFAVATDKDGTEIRHDDTVKEFAGEQRQGRVLHIHRTYLFCQNREQLDNAGIFVARNSSVVTVAAKGGRGAASSGPDLSKMNPAMANGGAAQAMAMPPPSKGGRDRMIGRTVTVRKGPYKGLLGIVKDATDAEARVELHTKNKVITVSKDVLTVKDPISGQTMDSGRFGAGGRGGGAFGGGMSRVPAGPGQGAWDGGRTPAGWGAGAGGKTPAWGAAAGARTPAWRGAGGVTAGNRTPAPGWSDGSRTVNPYADGSRTSYGGATAYGGVSFSNL